MALILMSCPTTHAIVATGQHVTTAGSDAVLAQGGRFRCSSCHQIHAWTRADVRLTDWPGATSTPGS